MSEQVQCPRCGRTLSYAAFSGSSERSKCRACGFVVRVEFGRDVRHGTVDMALRAGGLGGDRRSMGFPVSRPYRKENHNGQ